MPFAEWQVVAAFGIIFLSIMIGTGAANEDITWLKWILLPALTILVIFPPIWVLFGLGSRGIDLGQRWQVFSIIGLSMTLGPLIMIVLELTILIVILSAGGVFIAIKYPPLFNQLVQISRTLGHDSNPDLIINFITPYLKNPAVLGTGLAYIAVLVPLIEEFFKPLAVWMFVKRMSSPAQGFAMGMLCGGAFALIESLNASGDSSTSWAIIVFVRAGTSLLHMTASGLVGWGIVSAVQERWPLRFLTAYLTSAGIHGIWNACAAGISILSIGESFEKPGWLFTPIPALLCGMFVIGSGMFVVLIASNRKLRSTLQAGALEKLLLEKDKIQTSIL
jgi:hypothetical protein